MPPGLLSTAQLLLLMLYSFGWTLSFLSLLRNTSYPRLSSKPHHRCPLYQSSASKSSWPESACSTKRDGAFFHHSLQTDLISKGFNTKEQHFFYELHTAAGWMRMSLEFVTNCLFYHLDPDLLYSIVLYRKNKTATFGSQNKSFFQVSVQSGL